MISMRKDKVFIICDLDNFYVSCERVFNPKLIGKACIVSSNNNGCVVARSQEAKDIGIKMGVPIFKIRDLITKYDVQVLSSNYELYGEMSRRFHKILQGFASEAHIENYSIDEAFIDLTSYQSLFDPYQYCQEIRTRIYSWLGLKVSFGIGRSKKEAKVAVHIAKKNSFFNGVCDLNAFDLCSKEHVFSEIDVGEIWGVGTRISQRLKEMDINTVLDLACADDQIIKKYFSIVLQRTVLELRGISCLELESVPPPKQQIISSRSFPKPVTSRDELNDALLYHLQDAFKRLRDDKSLCGCITTFANSNYFDKNTSYYSKSSSYVFPTPTDNLLELSKAAARLTDSIYQSGVNFKKCGVGLTFLESKTTHNYDLLTDPEDIKRNESLMSSIEEVHSKFGKKTLALGASQMNQGNWQMTRSNLSINPFSIKSLLQIS